jgi:hypothetical protein
MGPDPDLARSQLRNIIKAIRRGQFNGQGSRHTKQECEYFCALETHSCGFVHAHLLQRGNSIPKRYLSSALPAYGIGRICWIRSISSADRPAAVARYVSRHLVGWEHADQVKQGRRIRYSRNFWGGCTTAQVAAALWPRSPDPATWTLEGPLRAAGIGTHLHDYAPAIAHATLERVKSHLSPDDRYLLNAHPEAL